MASAENCGTIIDQLIDCALDLLHRLPPQHINKTLKYLALLQPSLRDDIATAADQPLKLGWDDLLGKTFLVSDFNRDGDSYRSPWSNVYFPPLRDGLLPSPGLRKLEVAANEAFQIYLDLYFESGGTSSVYLWALDDGKSGDFAGAILLKKQGPTTGVTEMSYSEDDDVDYVFAPSEAAATAIKGGWDSIHVIEVREMPESQKVLYQLTSTVILSLATRKANIGMMNLGGVLSRQATREDVLVSTEQEAKRKHLINIGELVEENENRMKGTLQEVYFWRTKDVITRSLRSPRPVYVEVERQRRWSVLGQAALVRRTPSGKHLLVPQLQELQDRDNSSPQQCTADPQATMRPICHICSSVTNYPLLSSPEGPEPEMWTSPMT